MIAIADRAAGAVIGALIGDALALGPHWYYDLEELRRDYGDWISDYTNPKPGRYHSGMRAGELDQTGLLIAMLLRSVVENGTYVGVPTASGQKTTSSWYGIGREQVGFLLWEMICLISVCPIHALSEV